MDVRHRTSSSRAGGLAPRGQGTHRPLRTGSILLVLLLLPVACATPRGRDVDEKRDFVVEETTKTLDSFYAARPELRKRVEARRATPCSPT